MSAHAARLVVQELTKRPAVETELIDIAQLPLPTNDAGQAIKQAAYAGKVDRADAGDRRPRIQSRLSWIAEARARQLPRWSPTAWSRIRSQVFRNSKKISSVKELWNQGLGKAFLGADSRKLKMRRPQPTSWPRLKPIPLWCLSAHDAEDGFTRNPHVFGASQATLISRNLFIDTIVDTVRKETS